MKVSSRFNQFNSLISAAVPNKLGLEWRFKRYCCVFKNATLNIYWLNFLQAIYSLIIGSTISLYYFMNPRGDQELDTSSFPYSTFSLYSLVPEEIINITIMLMMLVYVISFLLGLWNVDTLYYTGKYLTVQLQEFFYPLYSIIACGFITRLSKDYQIGATLLVFEVVYLIIFVAFVIAFSINAYVENNSIIRPNIITSEWFIGSTLLGYAFQALFYFTCIQGQSYDKMTFVILLAICFFAEAAGAAIYIREEPIINLLVNNALAAYLITNAIMCVLMIINVFWYEFGRLSPIMFLVTFFFIGFCFSHFAIENHRRRAQRFLDQFDVTSEEYSVTTIGTVLESITEMRDIRMLVREGLSSGNPAVYSKEFVEFCLNKFGTTKWMVSYISFLFAINLGKDNNVYRFLLNYMSTDPKYGTNAQLYQAIYCFMQTSERISPVISRELDDFRLEMVQFATVHKSFWRSIFHQNENQFQDSIILLHKKRHLIENRLGILIMKYPFCPSVQIENAMYHADVKHNYLKSSEMYEKAVQLLAPNRSYVVNELFHSFSRIFPTQMPGHTVEVKQQKARAELRFISLFESHEHSLRYPTIVSQNDTYLKSLTHAFSVPTSHLPVNVHFDRVMTNAARAATILLLLGCIANFICIIAIYLRIEETNNEYNNQINLINHTLIFHSTLATVKHDIRLCMNVMKDKYLQVAIDTPSINTETTDAETILDNFYEFVISHLQEMELKLIEFKSVVNLEENSNNVNLTTRNCTSYDCQLSYLFGKLHNYLLYVLKSREHDDIMLDLADENIWASLDDLIELAEYSYEQLSNRHLDFFKTIKTQIIWYCTCLEIIDVVFVTVFLVSFIIFIRRIINNLFLVMKTIQPTVTNAISSQFDKLLSFEQYQRHFKKNYFLLIHSSIVIMTYLLTIAITLAITGVVSNTKPNPKNEILPEVLATDNETEYAIFAAGMMEYYWNISVAKNNMTSKIKNVINVSLDDADCMHYIYDIETKAEFYQFLDDDTITMIWAVTYLLLTFAVIFLILQIESGMGIHRILETITDVLMFVPSQARLSNPVLSRIMVGQIMEVSEVVEFGKAAHEPISELEFTAILHIDELGNITKIIGDIDELIGFRPQMILELYQYLEMKCPQEKQALHRFFEARATNDTRSVPVGDDREVTLAFSRRGTILSIKDDSHHHAANARQRAIERMQEVVKESPSNRSAFKSDDGIVMIVEAKETEVRRAVIDRLQELGRIPDTRFGRVVLIAGADKAAQILSAIEDLRSRFPSAKFAVGAGGQIGVLSGSATMEKTRLYGGTYEAVKRAVMELQDGGVFMMPSFSALLEKSS